MPFHPASPASVAAFVVIVLAVIGAFLCGVHRAYRSGPEPAHRVTLRTAAILALWLGVLSLLVGSGLMPSLPLSGIPLFFTAIMIVSVATGLSPFAHRLATALPLSALVAFQSFRLPLELVLHEWVAQGTIPATMTWSGQNWDIVSGLAALVACPFATRSRAAAWAANVIGAALLLNVMRVALFSAPVPFGWAVQPPLLLALHLPYALIGPVCVGGALAGHIVLTRALLRIPSSGAPALTPPTASPSREPSAASRRGNAR